jgi:hypothetical protein
MECIVDQTANIERTRKRIFDLLTQCIEDIRKTIAASGLKVEDIGSDSRNSRQVWILSSIV